MHCSAQAGTSAEGAIELLKEHSFTVVFTDIQLEGSLSGWDVADACRARQPDQSTELPEV